MRTKRKNLLIITVVVSIFVLFVSGIIAAAYFSSSDQKENKVKIGNNKIKVKETFEPPPNQVVGDNVFKKEVGVTNTGNVPCYVRIFVDFSDGLIRENAFLTDGNDPAAAVFYSAVNTIDSTDGITTFAEYINSGDKWVYVPYDSGTVLAGYYYYKTPLAVGASTDPLFTYVKTSNATTDDLVSYDIHVYSESVQIADAASQNYADYAAAWTDYLT